MKINSNLYCFLFFFCLYLTIGNKTIIMFLLGINKIKCLYSAFIIKAFNNVNKEGLYNFWDIIPKKYIIKDR